MNIRKQIKKFIIWNKINQTIDNINATKLEVY
jgi:hypothetical protein